MPGRLLQSPVCSTHPASSTATMSVSPTVVRGIFSPAPPPPQPTPEANGSPTVSATHSTSTARPDSAAPSSSRARSASISLARYHTPLSSTRPAARPRALSIDACRRPLPPRRRPGPFTLLQLLGGGACATTYAARDSSTNKLVCLKVYDKHRVAKKQFIADSIRRELAACKTLADAEHPFVMSCHGIFQNARDVFFAMELLERSLHSLCDGKIGARADVRRKYVAQIAAGIDHLHSLGIIHRDIKPQNILVSRSGDARICDFGSAYVHKRGGPLQRGMKYHQDLVYTPDYIAPEIYAIVLEKDLALKETLGYGLEIDWWGLGCIHFQLAMGRPPFLASSSPPDRAIEGSLESYIWAERREQGFAWVMKETFGLKHGENYSAQNYLLNPTASVRSSRKMEELESEVLVIYGLMHIDPIARWTYSSLLTEDFFRMDEVTDGHKHAFDYYRARADSWAARLYRPEKPPYQSHGCDRSLLDLVATTEETIHLYSEKSPDLLKFYRDFRWINPRTLWTVWSDGPQGIRRIPEAVEKRA